jgi:quinol monooxygenase YgiN
MKLRRWLACGAAVLILGCAASARAQAPAPAAPSQPAAPSGPVYVVTYFEVAPAAARKTGGFLRQFTTASRKEDGNVECAALREIARPGRFAIVEAWRDKAALAAHGAQMKTFGDKLQPVFASPFDARQFWSLSVAPAGGGADTGKAVFVLTHVDVFPAGKDEVAAMVKQLADDSRKDGGVVRFDALVQDAHPNHFHLVEAWNDRAAREAHALADHTRQFRAKLVPFEGALYDERLYEAVK